MRHGCCNGRNAILLLRLSVKEEHYASPGNIRQIQPCNFNFSFCRGIWHRHRLLTPHILSRQDNIGQSLCIGTIGYIKCNSTVAVVQTDKKNTHHIIHRTIFHHSSLPAPPYLQTITTACKPSATLGRIWQISCGHADHSHLHSIHSFVYKVYTILYRTKRFNQ